MTTIQKGDTVLVTGATGYIGSHVVEELIAAGYKVRGTSRTKDKAAYLTNLMDKRFSKGNLEIVEVPDMIADNAYTDAVKGVSGIVHLASILTFSSDPEEVIPPTVKGTLNVLEAATTEPKVKSFVYTSSSTAALSPITNKKIIVTKDTWNSAAVERVRSSASPSAYGKSDIQTDIPPSRKKNHKYSWQTSFRRILSQQNRSRARPLGSRQIHQPTLPSRRRPTQRQLRHALQRNGQQQRRLGHANLHRQGQVPDAPAAVLRQRLRRREIARRRAD